MIYLRSLLIACAISAAAFSQTAIVTQPPYSATGNGSTNDTAAIQKALDAIAGTGGTVYIPSGTYMINPATVSGRGLLVKGNTNVVLAENAVLKAMPTSASTYAVVMITGNGVSIQGGRVLGERDQHTGTGGEWGMGINITGSSNVTINGTAISGCWGDGIYIKTSTSVVITNVASDRNRRQGLSITSVDGCLVTNSSFTNTSGTDPQAGIDVEPNSGETSANVQIVNCTMSGNYGGGLLAGPPKAFAGLAFVTNLVVDGCTISGNGGPLVVKAAVLLSNHDGSTIKNCSIINNYGQGVMIRSNATHSKLQGNTISGTINIPGNTFWSGGGVYVSASPYTQIINNIVTGNQGFGIQSNPSGGTPDPTLVISGNTVSGNGKLP